MEKILCRPTVILVIEGLILNGMIDGRWLIDCTTTRYDVVLMMIYMVTSRYDKFMVIYNHLCLSLEIVMMFGSRWIMV